MTLKVGQRVRILDGRNSFSCCMEWLDEMDEYIGKETTIVRNNYSWADLDIDNGECGWDMKWLEVIE